MSKNLEIKATPSGADVCVFELSEHLLDQIYVAKTTEDAEGSPLLTALIKLEPLTEVLVMKSLIKVKQNQGKPWQELGKEIGKTIRDIYESGVPFFTDQFDPGKNKPAPVSAPVHGEHLDFKNPLIKKIQEVLDNQVAPALGAHGGNVAFKDFKEGYVYLEFGGGCQGCSQVSLTVKEGVEKLLRNTIPEIIGVRDITDHDMGDNPYYK